MGPLGDNSVRLKGKISKLSQLKYTARGTAVREIRLAVTQESFGETTVGYFEVMLQKDLATEHASLLKIGKTLELQGHLWSRTYRNRSGELVSETRIIATHLEGEKNV